MVVSTFDLRFNYSISAGRFCRFCRRAIYLLFILMKAVLNCIKMIAKQVNKAIVFIALLLTYVIVCIYHLFVKTKSQRWYKYNSETTLEHTNHLW